MTIGRKDDERREREAGSEEIRRAEEERSRAVDSDRGRPRAEDREDVRHVTEAREPSLGGDEREGLFGDGDGEAYRSRWESIQASFVDEPRRAVEEADALVRDLTSRIAEVFTAQRAALERQWDRGDEVSTEDLRVALQRYRDYFNRLLRL